jgi:hypothetical protein
MSQSPVLAAFNLMYVQKKMIDITSRPKTMNLILEGRTELLLLLLLLFIIIIIYYYFF